MPDNTETSPNPLPIGEEYNNVVERNMSRVKTGWKASKKYSSQVASSVVVVDVIYS
jgi:hypothetical protein